MRRSRAGKTTRPIHPGDDRVTVIADARWTRPEQNQVDAAIAHVAKTKGIFTADDVWQHLGDDFPVTKGLAGRLNAASRRGIIRTQANWHMRTVVARMIMHSV